MRRCILAAILISLMGVSLPLPASAQEVKLPPGVGWIYLQTGSRTMVPGSGSLKGKTVKIGQGSLVPVFNTRTKDGVKSALVRIFDLGTANLQVGWVEVAQTDVLPLDSYPTDSDLLRQLGEPYLDDFTAAHTHLARFLLRQGPNPPILLCYVYANPLPVAKLVAFTPSQGKFLLSASLDYSISNFKAGIILMDIRDLLGDGEECLITHEPFQEGPDSTGTNVVIRRIEGNKFQTLWQAPMGYRNFSVFTSKIQILQPPEKNIGAPGTVTAGDVTFRPQGKGQAPVWKGKVEFFAFGREKPVDSVSIEKMCPWDGKQFTPLR